jgi:putative zinc finger/helix-turn-helix YgiT family protein
MVTSQGDYHYTESGLNNVNLKGITIHHCLKCGTQVPVISRINEWHERISTALLAKPSLLTGEEFRFLRKEMRLKAVELASLMGVNKVTLSRWETNTEPISTAADRLLRYIYATKKVESLAKRLSVLNWAVFSYAIQDTMRCLEVQVKLIKRKSPRDGPITIDQDELTSCAYRQDYTIAAWENVNLNSESHTQWPPVFQPCLSRTKGTKEVLTCLQEVVLDG